MKKLILFFVLISLTVFGCKKEEKKAEAPETAAVVDTTNIKPIQVQENVYLKYDLKKNSVLRFRLTNYSKNTQTLQLDSTITGYFEQTVDYYFKVNVKNKEENGNLELDFLCEKIKATGSSSNGEKLEYDSENPPTDSLQKQIAKNFDLLLNGEFSVRLSPIGEVLDVYRFDSIVEKLLQNAQRKPTLEEREAIKNDIKLGLLRPIIQQIFREFPENSVNVDSTWQQTYPLQLSVFEIQNTAKYKVSRFFESNGNKLVEILGTLSIESAGKTNHTEGNITYKFAKPKATGYGKIYYDLDKKCVRNSTTDVTFELTVNMTQKGNPKTYKRIDKIQTKNSLLLLN
ncbi:MAG: DUF6263 family protein [Ignavibacteria bacterium]|jgi:hypothetical protein|nr:DUF6263 family protein [Ignavibacteria bacterium]MDH7527665.1 DUF6263 family protein [Ignavibacteria bacterium]